MGCDGGLCDRNEMQPSDGCFGGAARISAAPITVWVFFFTCVYILGSFGYCGKYTHVYILYKRFTYNNKRVCGARAAGKKYSLTDCANNKCAVIIHRSAESKFYIFICTLYLSLCVVVYVYVHHIYIFYICGGYMDKYNKLGWTEIKWIRFEKYIIK